MSKFNTALVSMAFVMSIVGAGFVSQSVSAATTKAADDCKVVRVGSNDAGKPDSRFILNKDGTVTARFKVEGKKCKTVMTLVAWEAPNGTDGKPYTAQKMYSYKTKTFGAGEHTITTKLPNCYYQVDLITGSNWASFPAQLYSEQGVLYGHLHGGKKSCEKTPTTPTQPVTPTQPTTPTEPEEEKPAVLPNTGMNSAAIIGSVLSVSTASTFLYRYFLSRRFM